MIQNDQPMMGMDTRPEKEVLADEAENLVKAIHLATQMIGGLGKTPKHLRSDRLKELYDTRNVNILRMHEIHRIAVEKGYIVE